MSCKCSKKDRAEGHKVTCRLSGDAYIGSRIKLTPGPWTVEVNDTHTNVEAPSFTVAADVSNDDAHLIAAAPEMYALLRSLLRNHGDTPERSLARVIAKAEGRE